MYVYVNIICYTQAVYVLIYYYIKQGKKVNTLYTMVASCEARRKRLVLRKLIEIVKTFFKHIST